MSVAWECGYLPPLYKYLEVSHKEMDSVVSTGVLLSGRVDAGEEGFHLVRVPRADSLQQLREAL